MSIKPSIVGGRRLRETAKRLRDAGETELPRNLQKAVEAAGQPTLTKLRESARTIKVTGYRTAAKRKFVKPMPSKDLRNRIAAATTLSYSNTARGARVSFETPSTAAGPVGVLPRYLDLGTKFRHPIMGWRSRWADESGEPWFFPPIKDSLSEFRDEIDKAIDATIDHIEAG